MIAILTRYIGPTNTKGSRYKAFTCNGHSVTIHAKPELNSDQNHDEAAKVLCKKMDWQGTLVRGGIEFGYAYCFIRRDYGEELSFQDVIKV